MRGSSVLTCSTMMRWKRLGSSLRRAERDVARLGWVVGRDEFDPRSELSKPDAPTRKIPSETDMGHLARLGPFRPLDRNQACRRRAWRDQAIAERVSKPVGPDFPRLCRPQLLNMG